MERMRVGAMQGRRQFDSQASCPTCVLHGFVQKLPADPAAWVVGTHGEGGDPADRRAQRKAVEEIESRQSAGTALLAYEQHYLRGVNRGDVDARSLAWAGPHG